MQPQVPSICFFFTRGHVFSQHSNSKVPYTLTGNYNLFFQSEQVGSRSKHKAFNKLPTVSDQDKYPYQPVHSYARACGRRCAQ
jgi:hypothetical protein